MKGKGGPGRGHGLSRGSGLDDMGPRHGHLLHERLPCTRGRRWLEGGPERDDRQKARPVPPPTAF